MKVVRYCGRCRRELFDNRCNSCNIYYGHQNTHPAFGLGCFVVLWIFGVIGCWRLAKDWENGIVPDGQGMTAAQIVVGMTAILTILIPIWYRMIRKQQIAAGERPITVLTCLFGLALMAGMAYFFFWMLTQS